MRFETGAHHRGRRDFMTALGGITATLFTIGIEGIAHSEEKGEMTAVIEVVTFRLRPHVTPTEFKPIDHAVETEHVSRQPGFVSREAAATDDGEWLVIVHWKSVQDAEASMASFMSAPAASTFMSKIDASTMVMKRYMR